MRTTKISSRPIGPNQEPASERTTERRDDRSGDALLTVHDVAELLHVPVSWVYEHTSRRGPDALPVVKVGKYVRFRAADLWNYIDEKSRVRVGR